MIEQPKDIPVFLCHDHFERLRRKRADGAPDVCSTCPSDEAHECVVKAVAAEMEKNPEFGKLTVKETMAVTQRLIKRALEELKR